MRSGREPSSATLNAPMTPYEFIAKWRASELKERSASQEHFIDLYRLAPAGLSTPRYLGQADSSPGGSRGPLKSSSERGM